MKMRLSLVIVAAADAAGCAVPGGLDTNARRRCRRSGVGLRRLPVGGRGAIHRKANDNAPVIFKLDNDSETALYSFRPMPVEFIQPTSEFTCATQARTRWSSAFAPET
jgi:hypothetical protein